MKRVSVVVVVALLNAFVFGVRGSALSLQTGAQDKETARQEEIRRNARRIPPGTAVRVERINGIRDEGLFDRVNNDGNIEILQVSNGKRETIIIPARDVKRVGILRGRPLNSFAKKAGIALVVLVGACAGLAAAAAHSR